MTAPNKLDPAQDGINTVRTLKRLFTGEMTLQDLLNPEGRIIKPCTKNDWCTEPDGHDGGCVLSTEGA